MLAVVACKAPAPPAAPDAGIPEAAHAPAQAAPPAAPVEVSVRAFNPAFGTTGIVVQGDQATCESYGRERRRTKADPAAVAAFVAAMRRIDLCAIASERREGLVNRTTFSVRAEGMNCQIVRPDDAWSAEERGRQAFEAAKALRAAMCGG